MITLPPAAPIVNRPSAASPRDAWTDEGRRELGPDDEPRPTAGPEFEPAPEDDAEWLGLRLALMAEAEALDHDAMQAERTEATFGDPDDLIPYEELSRVLGRRAHA